MKTFGRYLAESENRFCSYTLMSKLEALGRNLDFEEYLDCVLANQSMLKLPAPEDVYIDGILGVDIALSDLLTILGRNMGLLWTGSAEHIVLVLVALFRLGAKLRFTGERDDIKAVVKWAAGKLGENDANVKKIRAYMIAEELEA